jgi:hypothetical protein
MDARARARLITHLLKRIPNRKACFLRLDDHAADGTRSGGAAGTAGCIGGRGRQDKDVAESRT